MKISLLYIITVLIWGSTWLAMEFQLGEVPVEVSLVYRFAIATVLMWTYCLIAKVPMTYPAKNHLFIVVLALGNFSINYIALYWAQKYLISAIASIVFTITLLLNIVNTRLFFGTKIQPRVYLGACSGILGVIALFSNDISQLNASNLSLTGLALVMIGALLASFGNIASAWNAREGINVFAVNAWGMLYATIILVVISMISGAEFVISKQPSYIISLLYLAVFDTVIAFATFYILLRDLGPEKASYVIVLFPLVAVVLSSLFEGFVWTPNTFIGFTLVLLGNAISLTPGHKVTAFIKNLK